VLNVASAIFSAFKLKDRVDQPITELVYPIRNNTINHIHIRVKPLETILDE
jgi:hypothetical protein